MMRGEEIIHWLGRPFEPILFSFFVLPGPAVDDDDDVKGKEEKPYWGLAMGRTRVSDCLSRSLGRICGRKECIRKTVFGKAVVLRLVVVCWRL
jgi:hypothetical protein